MIDRYLKRVKEICDTNDFLEHSYRTPLENLLNDFLTEQKITNIMVLQEPRRSHFGAPDFKIVDHVGNVVGYIECKDVGTALERELESDQMKKYKAVSPNIIFTDYLNFILIKDRVVTKTVPLTNLSGIRSRTIPTVPTEDFKGMLRQFFLTKPVLIRDTRKLSYELAVRTSILKEIIIQELGASDENPFLKFFDIFKKTIVSDLQMNSFADMYAQIVGIGLLFLKLSRAESLTKENLISKIPKYIPLLRDFFPNASFDEWNPEIVWILDELLYLINSMDQAFIKKSLSYKDLSLIEERERNLEDPYINFYETFLTIYDKKMKLDKGVFYTPESVVSFIIRSLELILVDKLKVQKGFLEGKVKILDFASGTGTFILALIDHIYLKLIAMRRKTLFDSEIRDHILENVFGFELLIVPYIISHLRIHEYLESKGFVYSGHSKERAEIYLTNTLRNQKAGKTQFFRNLDEEADHAEKVKNQTEIMIIMGNPPYSNYSQNQSRTSSGESTWIGQLLQDYKPIGEKKLNLDDDYIKFIRFACWKLDQVEKGVIGVITNNSFLTGITHRRMRRKLIESFDEIYILNLHGNANLGETAPDGSADQNVFSIKDAGVCITFLVKKTAKTKRLAKLYYADLYGKQPEKYTYLYQNDINKVEFALIDYELHNKNFAATKWGQSQTKLGGHQTSLFSDGLNFFATNQSSTRLFKSYGDSWGLRDIFQTHGAGVKTDRDSLVIDLDPNLLQTKMQKALSGKYDTAFAETYRIENSSSYKFEEKIKSETFNANCIHQIDYRPFDTRYIYYRVGFTSRPAKEVFQHFLAGPNIGLSFKRQFKPGGKFTYAFVTDKLAESCLFESALANNSIAPLYLYSTENSLHPEDAKKSNFTPGFFEYVKGVHGTVSPEDLFGYIYAVLNSLTYRQKYEEFLRFDFPRIPLTEDKRVFRALAKAGTSLVDLHLLRANPNKKVAIFDVENPTYKVDRAKFQDGRVFFNESTYIDNVPKEVWAFEIGGYEVVKTWLEYRADHQYVLSNIDLQRLLDIVDILAATILSQEKIDDLTRGWI